MSEVKFENNEYTPLRDVVFASLRQSIITGELKPGDRLMEIKLSQVMGVSRTPVREAIKKLQGEGLVVMHPRKGAVVAPINTENMKEILEVRTALERLACALNCERANEEAIRKLRSINIQMAQAVKEMDIAKITEKDVEFHEYITEVAGNARLKDMLDQIKAHLFRYRLEFIKELDDRNVLVEEHNAIIDAIENKNTHEAVHQIAVHIDRQAKYIRKTLEK